MMLLYLYAINEKNLSDQFITFLNDFDINKKYLEYDGLKFKNHPTSWIFFESDDYFDKFNVKDRVVMDIGGNVGDTALKFAKFGANVYAFEPVPYLSEIAKENINLNPEYKRKINFYNLAISHKNGELTIYEDDYNSGGHSQFYENDNLKKHLVKAITIDDAIKKFDIKPDVLKIDCEGCEFNIILHSDLSLFNFIILEHHSEIVKKPCTLLTDKLKEQGFKIEIPNYSPKIGIIYAYK